MNGNPDDSFERPEPDPVPPPPPMPPPPNAPPAGEAMPAAAGYGHPGAAWQQMDFGRVFSTGLNAWFRNLIPFTALGTIIYAPLLALAVLFAQESRRFAESGGRDLDGGDIAFYIGLTLGMMILGMLLQFFLTATVVFGVFEQSLGRHPSIGRCLSMGLSRMLPVLGVSLVVGLAVGAGFLLLCVPGFIFWTMWYVVVPVAVVERVGVGGAMSRSQQLTKGNRWLVFALLLILMLLGGAVGSVLQFVVNPAIPDTPTGIGIEALIGQFINMLSGLLGAVMMTTAYYELRRVKEGIGIEELGAVFD